MSAETIAAIWAGLIAFAVLAYVVLDGFDLGVGILVITRMRGHQPTLDHVRRRTAEGKSRSEIIRCLKR